MKKVVGILLVAMALFVSSGVACADESGGDAVIQPPPIVWAEGGE